MVAILGSNTNLIFKLGALATAYGTAQQGGAGDKMLVNSLTHDVNADVIPTPGIGAGVIFSRGATKGNISPTVSIDTQLGPRNGTDRILAQMFGNDVVSSEITTGQSDYKHTLTFNPTQNRVYGTIAFDSSDSTVIEYPSCACTGFTITAANPISPVGFTADFLADARVLSGTVNTNSSLAASTIPDAESFILAHDDDLWIDTEGSAALSSADLKTFTSFVLNLTRPQEHGHEVTGTASAGAPRATELPTGTLTLTFPRMDDNSWLIANDNETSYKCRLLIEGTQIGSGSKKSILIYIPRMIPLTSPKYDVTETGNNPLTVTFNIYAAASNPTGMTSIYPYIEIINNISTAYIA